MAKSLPFDRKISTLKVHKFAGEIREKLSRRQSSYNERQVILQLLQVI